MIGKLRGKIEEIAEDHVILDVGGVGYLVFISQKSADSLKSLVKDAEVKLIIETRVKEDAIELFGFASDIEKKWFIELNKVQGVGAKVALKILSVFDSVQLTKTIASKDVKSLTKIPGIGPKLADRIILEMKERIEKIAVYGESQDFISSDIALPDSMVQDDAISALENLGYKKSHCVEVIKKLLSHNPSSTLEALITNSLRELNKKNV